jgi:hypothetical protein
MSESLVCSVHSDKLAPPKSKHAAGNKWQKAGWRRSEIFMCQSQLLGELGHADGHPGRIRVHADVLQRHRRQFAKIKDAPARYDAEFPIVHDGEHINGPKASYP